MALSPCSCKAMNTPCCAHLPPPPCSEPLSTPKQSSCPQGQVSSFAAELSLGTAFTTAGQSLSLKQATSPRPRVIRRHHCAQIGGFGTFYTVSHSICAPAELDFVRLCSKAAVFSCRQNQIAASSAFPSSLLCIVINELFLLSTFLINIKSLPLTQILPSD